MTTERWLHSCEVNTNEPRPSGRAQQAECREPTHQADNRGRVSVGTFNAAGEPGLTLWSGVSPVDYPEFVVVSEPDGQVVASAEPGVRDGEHHTVAPVEVQS